MTPRRRLLTGPRCHSGSHVFEESHVSHHHNQPRQRGQLDDSCGPRRGCQQDVRRRRRRCARARQRVGDASGGSVHGDHGAVRLRQVHIAARARRARPTHVRRGLRRRHRADLAQRQAAHAAEARPDRFRLPVVQPAPDAHRRGEHRAADPHRRPQTGRVVGPVDRRPRRPRRQVATSTSRAVRRPATEGRSRPRARRTTTDRVRRRAHGCARLQVGRRAARLPPGRRSHRWPDRRHGHARPGGCVVRRPRAVPRRRPHRRRDVRPDGRHGLRLHEAPGELTVMFTATLRGMLAHKLRVILTTASIALGVAFLAGSLILTDTMNTAFDRFFGGLGSGTDAVVRHEAASSAAAGVGVSRPRIPAGLLPDIRKVPGVAAAEGVTSGYALITDTHGKAVLPKGGAPTMGYTLPADVKLRGDVKMTTGRAPTGADEVAIDATAAAEHHIPLGSRIRLLFRGPSETFTVVGTVVFGKDKDLGGTTSAYFTGATAQRVLGTSGTYDEIHVRSNGDVSDATLAQRVNAVVPHGEEAVTGASAAAEASQVIKDQFAFVSVLFTVFAGIALFVGAFIIWNTFTMVVAQRIREMALMRAIGATRRQVMTNLLSEAVLLGVLASAAGVGLGAAVAKGLNTLVTALGFSLPTTTLQIHAHTVVVSMIVGVVVTLASALVPARRATKVLPVEALRDAAPGAKAPARLRAVAGVLLTTGGAAAMVAGLNSDDGTNAVLFGMLATLVGVITVAPLAVRPLAALIGLPIRSRGISGDLARQNAMRNPRRTASTATALMIGLTLVVGMGVLASSLKASFGTVLQDSTNAALYITPASGQGGGFSPEVTEIVKRVPGVASVSAVGYGTAKIAGGSTTYSSVDPATLAEALKLKLTAGSVAELDHSGVLVKTATAKANKWHVGQHVPVVFPATGKQDFTIRGTFDGTGYLDGDYLISLKTEEANVADRLESGGLVMLDKGANQATVKAAVAHALSAHPDAKVMDRKEFAKAVGGIVDQLLALVSIMLLLSVLIAFLGIVNTLALSVYERTRELGLLRAVGMTRGQVRSMVRWESVIISTIGATVGAGLGVGLGAALSDALKGNGVTTVAIPGAQIGFYLVAAAFAGVLAAVGPGRSASRVDVLKAVVTD